MKRLIITTAVVALLAAVAPAAWAQSYSYSPSQPIYGSPNYGWRSHSSTIGEGWLRGRADVMRAAGEYNYNTSLAAINAEEARMRHIENRQRYAETYFEMKEINRQARAAARGPRPTAEDLARYARLQVPERLAAHEVDTDRGVIHWPRVFDDELFAAARTAIDELARKDLTGYPTGENYSEAKALLGAMSEELQTRIDELPTRQYIEAKKFLIGLDLEFRSPQVSAALAAK